MHDEMDKMDELHADRATLKLLKQCDLFKIDDLKTLRALRRNQPGEVVSVKSYMLFVVDTLLRRGGYMRHKELVEEVQRHYEAVWGRTDLRRLRRVKGRKLQWRQLLASALAPLCKAQVCWLGKVEGRLYRVLLHEDTPVEFLDAARLYRKRQRKRSKKRKKTSARKHHLDATQREVLPDGETPD